jgi:hypothetical protein
MTGEIFLTLFKIKAVLLILVKVAILLKYFLFIRYRTSEWRPVHFIYFPGKEITASFSAQCIKVKKTQNLLTVIFVLLNLSLVFITSLL